MTQLSDTSKNRERFNSIVNRAIFIGFWIPFIPWAWHKVAEPTKFVPIAYRQVIHGDRTLSSLLLPFGLMICLLLSTIFHVWLFNRWKRDFFLLYKEEFISFKDAPLKTSIALIKVTVAVALFGFSAYLASRFIILR